MRLILCFALLLPLLCRAEESAYYKTFLGLVAPADLKRPTAVTSSLLVDTNNTASIVSGGHTNSLAQMWGQGTLAGISLRMSMSEVVAKWGKPKRLWSTCSGGPRFVYEDVSLDFHRDVLSEIIIFPKGKKGWFENGLNTTSSAKDFLGTLGWPAKQKKQDKPPSVLRYESPGQMLLLAFPKDGGGLGFIRLLTETKSAKEIY